MTISPVDIGSSEAARGPRAARLTIVSVDSHVAPPPHHFRPFVEREHIDAFEHFLGETSDAFARNAGAGSALLPVDLQPSEESQAYWDAIEAVYNSEPQYADPLARLQSLDEDGIAAEVIFHGGHNRQPIPFFNPDLSGLYGQNIPTDPEADTLRQTGIRAYNRWLGNFCGTDPDRLRGVGFVPIWDVDAAVREVAHLRGLGLQAVNLPAPKPNLMTYNRREYDPFWNACVEHDMTLHSHVAEGQVIPVDPGPGLYSMILSDLAYMSRRHLQHMIFGGVFERFPELKLILTEQAGRWVTPAFEILDSIYLSPTQARETPHIRELIPRKPSEYFATNIWVGASFAARLEVEAAVADGYAHRLMWGRDYPHPEGTWPNTHAALRSTFAGFPDDVVRTVLGDTAIDFLGLDRRVTVQIGDRIGPSMDAIQQPLDDVPDSAHVSLAFRKVGGYA